MINPSTTYAGVSGPSASAYVTYCSPNDALRAIQSVNNITVDGRLIKTSLGTTKYCSHFMKNQQCPKPDCMYLHELGDLEASFTKEEMHQGKHQEYEKRLHDTLIAATAAANNNNNNTDVKTTNGNSTSGNINNNSSTANGSTTTTTTTNTTTTTSGGTTTTNDNTGTSSPNGKLSECNKQPGENGPEKSKDAWPSLSVSPVNKEVTITSASGKSSKNGSNKENGGKKSKAEKAKNKKGSTSVSSTSSSSSSSNSTTSASANISNSSGNVSLADASAKASSTDSGFNITKENTGSDMSKPSMSADEELNLLSEIENDTSSNDLDGKADTPSLSLSSSGDSGTVSESVSGKSSPTNFSDHVVLDASVSSQQDVDTQQNKANLEKTSQSRFGDNFTTAMNNGAEINTNCGPLTNGISSTAIDTATRFAKLGLFDDNNSFFSSNTFQPSPFFGKPSEPSQTQLRTSDVTIPTSSTQLPDLLSGTESDKERHDLHDKLNILKSLGSDFGPQLGSLQNGYGSSSGLEELQKRRNLVNGLGSSGLLGKRIECVLHMQ